MVIKERPMMVKDDIESCDHADLTSCCCIGRGTSSVLTKFDNNTFYPNEIASCLVVLDNSRCDLRMTAVSIKVEHHISLKAHDKTFHDTFILPSEHAEGAEAHQKEKVIRNLALDFNQIKF